MSLLCHICDISQCHAAILFPFKPVLNFSNFLLCCDALFALASLSHVYAQRLTTAFFAKVFLSAMIADRSTFALRALRFASFVRTRHVPAAPQTLLHSFVVDVFVHDDPYFRGLTLCLAWRM